MALEVAQPYSQSVWFARGMHSLAFVSHNSLRVLFIVPSFAIYQSNTLRAVLLPWRRQTRRVKCRTIFLRYRHLTYICLDFPQSRSLLINLLSRKRCSTICLTIATDHIELVVAVSTLVKSQTATQLSRPHTRHRGVSYDATTFVMALRRDGRTMWHYSKTSLLSFVRLNHIVVRDMLR